MMRYNMMEFAIPTMNRKDPLTAAPASILLLMFCQGETRDGTDQLVHPRYQSLLAFQKYLY